MGVRHALAILLLCAAPALAQEPRDPFRQPPETGTPAELFARANAHARGGDLPRAAALYRQLAEQGVVAPSLFWNMGQVAAARGAWGEAVWADLRARDLDPFDPAIERGLEAAREAANLDAAELEPEPLAAAARIAQRFRLGLVSVLLAALSVLAHAFVRLRPSARAVAAIAWAAGGTALLAGALPIAGSFARPTAVVVEKGAALYEAASPDAPPLGALREGEVVPVLVRSGDYVQVQDSSGARGWAHVQSVRPLNWDRGTGSPR